MEIHSCTSPYDGSMAYVGGSGQEVKSTMGNIVRLIDSGFAFPLGTTTANQHLI